MHSADFRRLATRDGASRSERLFRAAVSAYCSLTRPTRREATQLDDLVAPIYADVPPEARRFAAAALSECSLVPAGLVMKLAQEEIEIATPILLRSAALGDADLISVIGRRGAAHARIIGNRSGLHPAIRALVARLAIESPAAAAPEPLPTMQPVEDAPEDPPMFDKPAPRSGKPASAEETRQALREMMRPAHLHDVSDEERIYRRLRETALTGTPSLFQTVLADCFDLDFRTARSLTDASGYAPLMAALRALGLGSEQAFVIVSAVYPGTFPHPEAIRLFLERYRLLQTGEAIERIRRLKADAIHAAVTRVEQPVRGDNDAVRAPAAHALKAS